jgi:hypothetical protein
MVLQEYVRFNLNDEAPRGEGHPIHWVLHDLRAQRGARATLMVLWQSVDEKGLSACCSLCCSLLHMVACVVDESRS